MPRRVVLITVEEKDGELFFEKREDALSVKSFFDILIAQREFSGGCFTISRKGISIEETSEIREMGGACFFSPTKSGGYKNVKAIAAKDLQLKDIVLLEFEVPHTYSFEDALYKQTLKGQIRLFTSYVEV